MSASCSRVNVMRTSVPIWRKCGQPDALRLFNSIGQLVVSHDYGGMQLKNHTKGVGMSKKLWVERNEKDGSWDAFSEDGAHIKFGKGKGLFTPGDLSKIALAACSALSSRFAIETALGEGKGASIVVDGSHNEATDAYDDFTEHIIVDATGAGLDDKAAAKLAERIKRHIDKSCTVKHTYEQATPVAVEITIQR